MSRPSPTRDELRERLNYDPETGRLFWRKIASGRAKVGAVAGCLDERGYIYIRIRPYGLWLAHRLVWIWWHGALPPPGIDIDHANGDKGDNRLTNLRLATRAQNNQNQRARKSLSGLKGVHWNKRTGKWCAQIMTPMQRKLHLGVFDRKEDAHDAYVAAAEQHFGEFARAK